MVRNPDGSVPTSGAHASCVPPRVCSQTVTDSDLCVKVGDPRVSPKAESEAISDASSVFGANEWLVDELYEQYLQD